MPPCRPSRGAAGLPAVHAVLGSVHRAAPAGAKGTLCVCVLHWWVLRAVGGGQSSVAAPAWQACGKPNARPSPLALMSTGLTRSSLTPVALSLARLQSGTGGCSRSSSSAAQQPACVPGPASAAAGASAAAAAGTAQRSSPRSPGLRSSSSTCSAGCGTSSSWREGTTCQQTGWTGR